MQYATCTVRLGGSLLNTVTNKEISVPELAILRHIHGADAVQDLNPTRADEISDAEERERLRSTYGKDPEQEDRPVSDIVFPDQFRALPTKWSQVGVNPGAEAKRLREEAKEAQARARKFEKAGADEGADAEQDDLLGKDEEAA